MKRTLLSVAGLLLLALPLTVRAQLNGDGFDYVINPYDTNTITITNYTGLSGIVTIPSTINGLTVTVIGNGTHAIATNIALTNVTIPDSVLEIADYAFYTNYYLTNVTFGQNVTGIGEASFYECEYLTNVTLPPNLVSIGYEAFYYCYSMTNCTLDDSLVTIDDYAFYEVEDLRQMIIPPSVSYIGYYAFYYCIDMTNLVIKGAPIIDQYAFDYDEYLTNVSIAGGSIGDYAFYECYDMENLNLGNAVTSIGYESFYECELLTNLTIPASVTRIGEESFYYCYDMTNLTILGDPDIGYGAFEYCYYMQNPYIHGGNIGYEAFYYCYMTNVTIGDGPASIAAYAFYYDPYLTTITMGTNVSSIQEYAFYESYLLKTATVSGSIDPYAFYENTNLANLTVNNGVIPYECFYEYPHLGNVTINNSSIGASAFEYDYYLTNLTIGPGVTTIGDYAFYYCEYMHNANIQSGDIGYAAFYECYDLDNLTIGPGVTSIGSYAFYDDYELPNVVIPATVTNLGEDAFYYCYGLTSATVDSAYVGDYAFYDDTALTSITFGPDVKYIGSEVLDPDKYLTSIYFEGNAPAAGEAPFYGITNGTTTVYYYTDTSGWGSAYENLPTMGLAPNALQVTLSPLSAIAAGASWQLDNNGAPETNGVTTLRNIATGTHTVSFTPISGWLTPASQTVTIANGQTAAVGGIYIPTNVTAANGLVLETNGYGVIHHGAWPSMLVNGKNYSVTAVPDKNNIFVSWTGGATNQPITTLSTSPNFTFTMEAGLILSANFETNGFEAASGTYNGIFYSSSSNGVTENTAGMLKGLTLRNNGGYSGTILYEGGSHGISGSFNALGTASNHITRPSNQGGAIQVQLNLDTSVTPTEVVGTVSGTNGLGSNGVAWTANLTAYLATNSLPSADYTMLIGPDTNTAPPTNSPGGDGYALISTHKGMAKVMGALADGTAVSETAPVSQGSYIPIYDSLYNNKGLLLGWINLNTTNTNNNSLTWIHPVTTKGLYEDGFTNILGTSNILIATWTNPPSDLNLLTGLSEVSVVGQTNVSTNFTVTTSASGGISGTEVSGSIDLKTGQLKVVIGSGADKITGYGAVVLGTNGAPTNAAGYFLTSTNAQGIELTQ